MMGNGIQSDDYTCGILMKGLCLTNRIGDGFKLLQVMKTRGITPNTVIYNTLIHALCKNGKIGRARSLMRDLVEPSDVTFNILLSAYCGEGSLVQALVMLEKSFNKGYIPDVITVIKVVGLLCNNGRVSEAVELLERIEERGGGRVENGWKILEVMNNDKQVSAFHISPYNGVIYGFYKETRLEEALAFLRKVENLFPLAVDRSVKMAILVNQGRSMIRWSRRVFCQVLLFMQT
uniref:Pentatricopeptide repeat-containing protein, mitochondrial n=1 Tax=Solanum tuberosum TaxID=4113 RepID=M1AVN3_SOLTU